MQIREIRRLRALEWGEPFPPAGQALALVYPGSYRAGMSSLGFQWVGHLLAGAGYSVERVFLHEARGDDVPRSMESERPLGDFPLLAISVAWEPELADMVRLLEAAGIPPLRRERGPAHPQVLLGGPLTLSNPLPAAPFCDAMVVGEAEDSIAGAVAAMLTGDGDAAAVPGGWVPGGAPLPAPACVAADRLPAHSRLFTPETEFADMFLVEGERGCSRRCRFCVMGRAARGSGMRLVQTERILASIPHEARRVGLVGAGICDHPQLESLLRRLIEQGREVGISSLRADRLARRPELAALLHTAGYRTLTVASDAASQRLRDTIHKDIDESHLLACARLASEVGFRRLKLYVMVGLPDETDDDLEELIAFARRLAEIHPLDLGVSPFVPKPHTPMERADFAGVGLIERRLARLQHALRGKVTVRPASARWAWVESVLARGGEAEGEAVVEAVRLGGRYSAFKRVFRQLGHRPDARRIPTTRRDQ